MRQRWNRCGWFGALAVGALLLNPTPTDAAGCDPLPTIVQAPLGSPVVPTPVTTAVRTSDSSYCLYGDVSNTALTRLLFYIPGYGDGSTQPVDAMFQYLATNQEGELGEDDLLVAYANRLPFWPWSWRSRAEQNLEDVLGDLAARGIEIEQVVLAGFSAGGITAANVAARWKSSWPTLEALVVNDPAGLDFFFSLGNLSAIPASTRLLVVQAETSVGSNSAAGPIWEGTAHIPLVSNGQYHKNYWVVSSDVSHSPTVVSEHLSIQATGSEQPYNHIDYYGYWRRLYRAAWQAFLDAPLGDGSAYCNDAGPCELSFMGIWQDGIPATESRNAHDLGL
ncbi:MAG: hypothetical protein MJE66_00880 [Proteobacteria bacterium]|nr:hypothetical protein [Pseudomonadota bacterium]